MVAQYFKRRREFVEIFIVSGSGLGIAIMSIIIKTTIGCVFYMCLHAQISNLKPVKKEKERSKSFIKLLAYRV